MYLLGCMCEIAFSSILKITAGSVVEADASPARVRGLSVIFKKPLCKMKPVE